MYSKYLYKVLLLILINISLAYAIPIDNIDVSGYNRDEVISLSSLGGKTEINEEDIETAKDNIMASGLFLDVDISIKDTTLNISVLDISIAYIALL